MRKIASRNSNIQTVLKMQARVVEFEDDRPGRQRNNVEGNEERKGPIEYPERNPLDLIEEDKRPFARRKLSQTCCGGCRTVYDEVTGERVHIGLFLVQILTYIFVPGIILLFTLLIMPKKDDRFVACAIVAGILLLVCGSLHLTSFCLKR
jgi:hypothetical protein